MIKNLLSNKKSSIKTILAALAGVLGAVVAGVLLQRKLSQMGIKPETQAALIEYKIPEKLLPILLKIDQQNTVLNKLKEMESMIHSGQEVLIFGALLYAFSLFERTVLILGEKRGVSVLKKEGKNKGKNKSVLTILKSLAKIDPLFQNLQAIIWIQLNVRNNLVHGSFENIDTKNIKPTFTIIKEFVEAHASVLEPQAA